MAEISASIVDVRAAYALLHGGRAPGGDAQAGYCKNVAHAEWRLAVALGFAFNTHTPEEEIAAVACDDRGAHSRELHLQAHRVLRAAASTNLKLRFDGATLACCALVLAARMQAQPPAAGEPPSSGASALSLTEAARLLRLRQPPTAADLGAVDAAIVAYWSDFHGAAALDALARITRSSVDDARAALAARVGLEEGAMARGGHGHRAQLRVLYSPTSPTYQTPPPY